MKIKILPFIKIISFVLIFSPFFICSCFAQPSGWPMFQGNPARTGFSSETLPVTPKTLWQITVGDLRKLGIEGFETRRPIIAGNKVFFAASEVLGLNLSDGKILWHYQDRSIPFYPGEIAAGDNKVFFTVNNTGLIDTMSVGHIYALNSETGQFLWKYQTQSSISHSKPLIAQGKIFIGDDAGFLYAIDVSNGSLSWQTRVVNDGEIHASPAYADNKVFITTEGDARYHDAPPNPSSVLALNPETGEILWTFAISYIENRVNLIHSTPAISDSVLYVGSENGWFYALSINDGSLIWKKEIANGLELTGSSAPAGIAYDKVFIGTWQGKFFALSTQNGETVWESEFGYANNAAPLIASNKVCVAGNNNSFYCLNEANGKLIWQENLSATAAAISNGILVIPASSGDNFTNQTALLSAFANETTLVTTVPITVPTVPPITQVTEALSLSPTPVSPSVAEAETKEAVCGNTICEDASGENEQTCPQDCIPGEARPSAEVQAIEQKDKQKQRNYLIIGFVVGGLILAGGVGTAIWFFWKKRKKSTISPEIPPIS